MNFSPDMTEVSFDGGLVVDGETFTVTLVLWDDGIGNNLGPADVFGTASVPEPSSTVLLGLGGLTLFWGRRRSSR